MRYFPIVGTVILFLTMAACQDNSQVTIAGLPVEPVVLETGEQVYADNCAACHGDGGQGGLGIGAPSLTDRSVIYGQDWRTVMKTLRNGRHGVMPAWSGRLSDAEINLLAIFVARLSENRVPK